MSIPWWEDSQWYIHKTDLDKNITGQCPITDTDMYIPLWEDSQWYTIKPASDLAEDCQVWCGGDEKYKKIYVTCYMYMLHVTCYLLHV
jgi:hypothetical protein